MLSVYRFANRNSLDICNKYGSFILARTVTMKVLPEQPLSQEDFFKKNEKLQRPQSPHLTIYRHPFPSMLSISHRITGVMISGYVMTFGIGALVLPHDWPYYISAIDSLGPITVFFGKACLTFPFVYHFYNGIRHLFWDVGKFFKLNEVYTTGYVVLGATAVTSFILSIM